MNTTCSQDVVPRWSEVCDGQVEEGPPVVSGTERAMWRWTYVDTIKYAIDNYWFVVFPIGGLYLGSLFALRRVMADRKAMSLRGPLVVWNFTLAVFSVVCTWNSWNAYYAWTSGPWFSVSESWHESLCTPWLPRYPPNSERLLMWWRNSGFWGIVFSLSKVWELGDSYFIVLRKKPVTFLHWFHHVVTMIYCFRSVAKQSGVDRHFLVMNTTVHSIMYTYFTVRALRLHIPHGVKEFVTVLQILQMFVGVFFTSLINYFVITSVPCTVDIANLIFATTMYYSYCFLFIRFFVTSYIVKPVCVAL